MYAKRTKIKICGLRSMDIVQAVSPLPIDYIGFVFAPSKRQVTPEQVKLWVAYIHQLQEKQVRVPQTVGVFVNPTQSELTEIVQSTQVDYVQLHHQETPEFCAWVKEKLGKKIIKSVAISAQTEDVESHIERTCVPYEKVIDILLLDTYDPVYGGGSGKTFQWSTIAHYHRWALQAQKELFVAGGLHADNISLLLSEYDVDGVDVSSGVETEGIKDMQKIREFVERVVTYGSRT